MKTASYFYAGFRYIIAEYNRDGAVSYMASPAPGQHAAANKEKHRRAAVELWEEDGRPGLIELETTKGEPP